MNTGSEPRPRRAEWGDAVSLPLGGARLLVRPAWRGGALARLALRLAPGGPPPRSPRDRDLARRLAAWLAGDPDAFGGLPLDPGGTPFQHRVWTAARAIPRGRTRTYGALAGELGTAPRAVGRALAANPLPLVVPCHRVVGAGGALTGFSAGLRLKRLLLDLEQEAA
ncbi:methylated-DNA--[protein]-cysteine S-methyltransferase [Dissulfurirhabdus thermomarina]|uniref:methylated-DNA--[protein]-cysteine S-methyltransferase n=1 Tax=Dissulfurirhabdus thermomarina TaxID=1765737 RepID=A0A6N9TLQ4_DISTH|nr:methylated-DNA--[protein]-cysteine S-methyltransferase [Dissulfurirhabdus thermomarina]NDY42211.1 methylated-DNA--[protein]-cysteine S-methyltransferase [Dissulfurirhabdus thermomarina]NMX24124.1 methylated-DNA--[protein]-cysteine S-methyltransferase [Dissulfurirhabdus thermomarina]